MVQSFWATFLTFGDFLLVTLSTVYFALVPVLFKPNYCG